MIQNEYTPWVFVVEDEGVNAGFVRDEFTADRFFVRVALEHRNERFEYLIVFEHCAFAVDQWQVDILHNSTYTALNHKLYTTDNKLLHCDVRPWGKSWIATGRCCPREECWPELRTRDPHSPTTRPRLSLRPILNWSLMTSEGRLRACCRRHEKEGWETDQLILKVSSSTRTMGRRWRSVLPLQLVAYLQILIHFLDYKLYAIQSCTLKKAKEPVRLVQVRKNIDYSLIIT